MENKNYIWRPMSEYTGGRVLATNGLDVLIGEINSDGDCESEEDSGTILCGITGFIKIEEILPESEDERIRRCISDVIREYDWSHIFGVTKDDCLAWLEKQGDKNSRVILPAFTFDDVLALQCCMGTVKEVQMDKDLYEKLNDLHDRVHDAYHLEKQCEQKSYASETMNEKGDFDNGFTRMMEKEQKPADEELKKLLRAEYEKGRAKGKAQTLCEMPKEIDSQVWQIANNAAITWEQSFAILMAAKNAYDKGKADAIVQTPVWSEDDEKMWLSAIEYVRTHPAQTRSVVEWLKSLKDRVIPQPKQEWSEEDERIVTRIVESLSAYADKLQYEGFCHNSEVLYEQIDWLKSIKERYIWKPSDEQMASITCAMRKMKESAYYDSELESLFNDLKKLKD